MRGKKKHITPIDDNALLGFSLTKNQRFTKHDDDNIREYRWMEVN